MRVKIGDIVKLAERFEKQRDRIFLVLGRYIGAPQHRECPDDSIWAEWAMVDMTTGSIYTQISRDLELVNARA